MTTQRPPAMGHGQCRRSRARFLLITRHPLAVALSTQRVLPRLLPLRTLIANYIEINEFIRADSKHLKHSMVPAAMIGAAHHSAVTLSPTDSDWASPTIRCCSSRSSPPNSGRSSAKSGPFSSWRHHRWLRLRPF